MSVRIIDGTGTRYAAGVNSEARLRVASVNKAYAENVNQQFQKAYTLMYSQTPSAGKYFLYIKNLSDENVVLAGIAISCGTNERVEIVKDLVGTPVGTVAVPVNRYVGSGNTAEGTFVVGNDITGISGGTVVQKFSKAGDSETKCFTMYSGLVIPKNKNIALRAVTGGVAVDGCVCFVEHGE